MGGFEQAGIDDGVTGIEGEDAVGIIGVDGTGGLVDQRQVAVAVADLAGAGDSVVNVGQGGVGLVPTIILSGLSERMTWPPP